MIIFQWTGWDLNPRPPPCEGGDLPPLLRKTEWPPSNAIPISKETRVLVDARSKIIASRLFFK